MCVDAPGLLRWVGHVCVGMCTHVQCSHFGLGPQVSTSLGGLTGSSKLLETPFLPPLGWCLAPPCYFGLRVALGRHWARSGAQPQRGGFRPICSFAPGSAHALTTALNCLSIALTPLSLPKPQFLGLILRFHSSRKPSFLPQVPIPVFQGPVEYLGGGGGGGGVSAVLCPHQQAMSSPGAGTT